MICDMIICAFSMCVAGGGASCLIHDCMIVKQLMNSGNHLYHSRFLVSN